MPSEFFRTSTTWVVDFRYEGRPRRWFKVFGPGVDVRALMDTELRQLYGDRAQVVDVRPATDEEEAQYLRGEEPKSSFCPTGRGQPGPDACWPGAVAAMDRDALTHGHRTALSKLAVPNRAAPPGCG